MKNPYFRKLVFALLYLLTVWPLYITAQTDGGAGASRFVEIFGVGPSSVDPLDPSTYPEPVAAMLQSLPTQIFTGQVTVVNSGTRVQLSAASRPITGVVVRAMSANNAALVYVGKSTVTTSTGYELQANESVAIPINNLNLLWVDADTNASKICYLAVAL